MKNQNLTPAQVGDYIKKMRMDHNYSIEQIAKEAHVSAEEWKSYEENGDIPFDTLYLVLVHFNISILDFAKGFDAL